MQPLGMTARLIVPDVVHNVQPLGKLGRDILVLLQAVGNLLDLEAEDGLQPLIGHLDASIGHAGGGSVLEVFGKGLLGEFGPVDGVVGEGFEEDVARDVGDEPGPGGVVHGLETAAFGRVGGFGRHGRVHVGFQLAEGYWEVLGLRLGTHFDRLV